jgi:hypothetical protein
MVLRAAHGKCPASELAANAGKKAVHLRTQTRVLKERDPVLGRENDVQIDGG